ncbi:MAG: hypothetical protein HRT89_20325, partial [Lentisphaeria bacterium]|nr:hypothetical protein [Lentisphaeria bacterium]NQZ70406.1 hypothetical protein [Lentisphaeria bacterium]
MSDKPITDRIIKASAVIALAHLILKMAGLIQAKAGAHYMSTSEYEAILVVAFDGVILALFFIGEEVIGPSFLPVFLKEKDDKGEDAAWLFTSIFVSIQFIILIVVVSILMLFPDFIISVLTKWSPEENPNRYPLLKESIVWLAPSLICLSLGSTTYMLLNGYKKFFLAAIGDAAWKFCVVIALVVGIGIFNYDYKAILFGLLIGSLAKLITHLFGLLSHLTRFRVSFNWNNPAMKTVLLLILPLLAGILFAKFRDIFNNVYVLSGISSSVKGGSEGLMQANNLGKKLFDGINAIVPYAIHIALLPFFCELVDQKDTRKLGELISKCIR